MLALRNTSFSKFLAVKFGRFCLKVSEPMMNGRSTTAEGGTKVLYLMNSSIQITLDIHLSYPIKSLSAKFTHFQTYLYSRAKIYGVLLKFSFVLFFQLQLLQNSKLLLGIASCLKYLIHNNKPHFSVAWQQQLD